MKEELEFFQAWWKILKKYWNPPAKDNESKEAEKFWKSLISDCRNLRKRYDHNELFEPFARKMCLDLIDEIDRRAVELHKKER